MLVEVAKKVMNRILARHKKNLKDFALLDPGDQIWLAGRCPSFESIVYPEIKTEEKEHASQQ